MKAFWPTEIPIQNRFTWDKASALFHARGWRGKYMVGFYEGPDDIHTVGRNASNTKPAKFLVLLLKNSGAEPVLPAE